MNDRHLEVLLQIKGDLGEVRAACDSNMSYTKAVSEKLNKHVEDPEAHGLGGEKKATDRWMAWLAILTPMVLMVFEWWKHK